MFSIFDDFAQPRQKKMTLDNTPQIYRSLPEVANTPSSNSIKSFTRTVPLVWTAVDTRNAALLTVPPLGFAWAKCQAIGNDPSVLAFLQLESPEWMPKKTGFYTIMDLLTTAPLGYASYVAFKMGGGFGEQETRLACSLYGLTLLTGTIKLPAMRSKDPSKIAMVGAITSILSSATAYAFFKIDETAGYLTLPFALWNVFCTIPWAIRALGDGREPRISPGTSINTKNEPIKIRTAKGIGHPMKQTVEVQKEEEFKEASTGMRSP